MRVILFSFGRIKTPGLQDTSSYYTKLLSGFCALDWVELKPEAVLSKDPAARKVIQKKEGKILLDKIDSLLPPSAPVFLLEERGSPLTSEDWAKWMQKQEQSGQAAFGLCVGSSLGFSDEVRKRAGKILSLGPQTLSHDLARIVLLEQLFRAFSILRNHPYHNAFS